MSGWAYGGIRVSAEPPNGPDGGQVFAGYQCNESILNGDLFEVIFLRDGRIAIEVLIVARWQAIEIEEAMIERMMVGELLKFPIPALRFILHL